MVCRRSFPAPPSPLSPVSLFSLCLELSCKQEAAGNNEQERCEERVREVGRGVQFFQRWTWNVNRVVTAITSPIINVIYPHVVGWEWFGLFDSVVWPGHINTARCALPRSLQRSRLRVVKEPPGSVVFTLTISQGRAGVQQKEERLVQRWWEGSAGMQLIETKNLKLWWEEKKSRYTKKRFSGV